VTTGPRSGALRFWLLRAAMLRRHRLGMIGLGLTIVIALAAIAAPLLAPYDPAMQFAGKELLGPTAAFPLGTDRLGRDVLSRLLYGGRPTLLVGLIAVPLGAIAGTIIGIVAGYTTDLVDAVSMRLMDLIFAFPAILIGVLVVALRGPGVENVALAIAINTVPMFARLARAGVTKLRHREFIEASVAVGSSRLRIMFRELLPNIIPSLLVQVGVAMAVAGLLEAGLSFLGLGSQAPDPSWGNMLGDARATLRQAPMLGVYPGLCLAAFLIGLNFLVDGLRDVLDPRDASSGV
jgi:peptide/nickel transport system permease protein